MKKLIFAVVFMLASMAGGAVLLRVAQIKHPLSSDTNEEETSD